MSLDSKQIKNADPGYDLVNMLTSISGLKAHRSNIFLLLSEAYNNALDHGVLKLDSQLKTQDDGFFKYYELRAKKLAELSNAKLSIDVSYCPDSLNLYFIICDSGCGYTHQQDTLFNDAAEFGRGLSLLDEIAQRVTYNSSGNQVEMCYKLS